MNSNLVFAAILILAAAPLPSLAASGSNDAGSRSFSRTIPAAGLSGMNLHTSVGEVKVTSGTGNVVKIKVKAEPGGYGHFIFAWTNGPGRNELPADLHLVTQRQGNTLVVRLASAGSSGAAALANPAASVGEHHGFVISFNGDHEQGWKADWTLVLPARFALDLHSGVVDADIAGIGGGLDANIGVGHLDAQLPRGPMNVKLGVGDINASVASADYGDVDLAAGVGDVEFSVNGRTVGASREQHFTAASQQINGPGQTAYILKAGVGHIELNLGARSASGATDEGHSGTGNDNGQH